MALELYTQEDFPLDWAMTQYNLGIALQELGKREGNLARLEAAVEALKAYDLRYTRKKIINSPDWAMTQFGRRALFHLEARVARPGLRRRWTPISWPLSYTRKKILRENGLTQYNLGIALQELGVRAGNLGPA